MLNRHLNCFFNEYTSSPGLILSLTSTKDIVILFFPTAKTNPFALSAILTSS